MSVDLHRCWLHDDLYKQCLLTCVCVTHIMISKYAEWQESAPFDYVKPGSSDAPVECVNVTCPHCFTVLRIKYAVLDKRKSTRCQMHIGSCPKKPDMFTMPSSMDSDEEPETDVRAGMKRLRREKDFAEHKERRATQEARVTRRIAASYKFDLDRQRKETAAKEEKQREKMAAMEEKMAQLTRRLDNHEQILIASISRQIGWDPPPPRNSREFVARYQIESPGSGPRDAIRVMHQNTSFKKHIESLKHPEKGNNEREVSAVHTVTAWINDATSSTR